MELKEREIRPITIDAGRQHRRYGYRFIKRVFDFVASLLGLIILSPLFLIIAIAIKVEDPKGAVFYSQTRLGRGEVPFKMYKFRSMVSNADELLEKLLRTCLDTLTFDLILVKLDQKQEFLIHEKLCTPL